MQREQADRQDQRAPQVSAESCGFVFCLGVFDFVFDSAVCDISSVHNKHGHIQPDIYILIFSNRDMANH